MDQEEKANESVASPSEKQTPDSPDKTQGMEESLENNPEETMDNDEELEPLTLEDESRPQEQTVTSKRSTSDVAKTPGLTAEQLEEEPKESNEDVEDVVDLAVSANDTTRESATVQTDGRVS